MRYPAANVKGPRRIVCKVPSDHAFNIGKFARLLWIFKNPTIFLLGYYVRECLHISRARE